jgi:hypothetical protein
MWVNELNLRFAMTKFVLALAIGLATTAATVPNATAAPPESQRLFAAPFPGGVLIYHPDCTIKEDLGFCDGGSGSR